MTLQLSFEIRSDLIVEPVKIEARTKNGVQLPPMEFNKEFYRAEFHGEMCLIRLARNSDDSCRKFHKGDIATFLVQSFGTERDVANFSAVGVVNEEHE